MKIFWMLTSRFFKLYWWSPLLKIFIQYLLCCFINMEVRMLQSKIACHTFLCLYQPRPLWNWLMETRDMPKELGLFYVAPPNIWLYIQLDYFIISQFTLTTLSHQVPSNFILMLKRLNVNLLNIVTFWPSRSFLEITRIDSKQSWLSSNRIFKVNNNREKTIVIPTVCGIKKKASQLVYHSFGHVSITRLK